MADCKSCKEAREKIADVPRFVHEITVASMERTIKRLWITIIVLIALIFAGLGGVLLFLNQYEFESYDYSQDGNGVNIIGESNEVDYGTTSESSPNG